MTTVIKGLGYSALATGVAAVAAESHIATIEVIKHVGTVCVALVGVIQLARILVGFFRSVFVHEFKEIIADAVADAVSARMALLPCAPRPVQTLTPPPTRCETREVA